MHLVGKYPTGTQDLSGHVFVKPEDIRFMIVFFSLFDAPIWQAVLIATYEGHIESKDVPWSLKKCLSELDDRKKFLEECLLIAKTLLSEYRESNEEKIFSPLLAVIEEVKKGLVLKYGTAPSVGVSS